MPQMRLRTQHFAAMAAFLGLSVTIHASSIFGVGVDVSLRGAPQGNSNALYDSQAFGGDSGTNVGLTYTIPDPTGSLTTIPTATTMVGNPQLMLPGGLNAVSLTLASILMGSSVTGGANLVTGITNLGATSSNGNGNAESETAATVTILDGVTFNQTAQIGVNFTLSGAVQLLGDNANYDQTVLMDLGNSQLQFLAAASNSNGGSSSSNLGPGTENWVNTVVINQTTTSINFTGYMNVTAGQDLQFELQQSIDCNMGAVCDFVDPGQISLLLPQGVTYTSDSGVFLSGAQSATPEPATFGLTGAFLAAIGLFVRGRRGHVTRL